VGNHGFRAVLFDFDGTLTKPEALDFSRLRSLLQCPEGQPILEYIEALPSSDERREKHRILDEFEMEAARLSVPNEGAEELVGLLKAEGIRLGIVSRNSRASVLEGMRRFRALGPDDFGIIVSRESPGRPKPHPDGVRYAAGMLGLETREILVVGDFVFDVMAAKAAGSGAAYLTNGKTPREMETPPDFTITSLLELRPILGV
jgi:HAD superfamily hydrolase (TIGR01509 family)